MADPVRIFAVDNIGSPEPVVVQTTPCNKIILQEANGLSTQDFRVYRPGATCTPSYVTAGSPKILYPPAGFRWFIQGETVAYAATVAGSISMAQEEEAV